MASQTQPKPCLWKECSRSFDNLETLLNHLLVNHVEGETKGKGEWKCLWDNCPQKPYAAKASLRKHIPKHSFGFPLPSCTICSIPQEFNSSAELDVHLKQLHQPLPELPPPSFPPLDSSSSGIRLSATPVNHPSSSTLPLLASPSATLSENPVLPPYKLDLSHLSVETLPTPLPCYWNEQRHLGGGAPIGGGGGSGITCRHVSDSVVVRFRHVVEEHIRQRARAHNGWDCFWAGCTSRFGSDRQPLIDHIAASHFNLAHRQCPAVDCDASFSNSNLLSLHKRRQHSSSQLQPQPRPVVAGSKSRSSGKKKSKTRAPKKGSTPSTDATPMPSQNSPLPPSQIQVPPVTSYYTPR
ncbi:uncharacterized protein JCM6883_007608 [Sporobolomyces salmoneus]|uniref:uncharacterized protein n=1 Tax=Sporobolomyces salmoneus TaxID=183962 RepID=UPI00317E9EC6